MSVENKTRPRMSNFELLRCIAMLMIMASHYFAHGAGYDASFSSKVVEYSHFLASGNTGVAIFLLITGWFLSDSKFSTRKWLSFVGEVWFYSLVCLIVGYICCPEELSSKTVITSVFPISSGLNWYAGNYIIAYLFLPYIKKACIYLGNIPETYDNFIILMTIVFSVIGLVTPYNVVISDFAWMLYLFFLGDYIRKQNRYSRIKSKTLIIIFTASIIGNVLIHYTTALLSNMIGNEASHAIRQHIFGRYSIVNLITAVPLLILFSRIQCQNRIINVAAKNTLAVYLVHDNIFMRNILWYKLLRTDRLIGSGYQVIHCCVSIVTVYTIITIVDYIRQLTIEKVWLYYVDHKLKDLVNELIYVTE